jgi:hypothetical protein
MVRRGEGRGDDDGYVPSPAAANTALEDNLMMMIQDRGGRRSRHCSQKASRGRGGGEAAL